LKKSEELLLDLEDDISEYIKSVGSFQYENVQYSLVRHYRSGTYLTCEICGHERIIDVYEIKDDSGKKWIVGNVCIDNITNRKIKEWFTGWKQKKDCVEKNRYWIDEVSDILERYESGTLSKYISKMGVERLRKMLERMCKGLDPLEKTVKLANYYIRKMARA